MIGNLTSWDYKVGVQYIFLLYNITFIVKTLSILRLWTTLHDYNIYYS